MKKKVSTCFVASDRRLAEITNKVALNHRLVFKLYFLQTYWLDFIQQRLNQQLPIWYMLLEMQ